MTATKTVDEHLAPYRDRVKEAQAQLAEAEEFHKTTTGGRMLMWTPGVYPGFTAQGLFKDVKPAQVDAAIEYMERARLYMAGRIGDSDVTDRLEWDGDNIPLGALIAAARFFEMPLIDAVQPNPGPETPQQTIERISGGKRDKLLAMRRQLQTFKSAVECKNFDTRLGTVLDEFREEMLEAARELEGVPEEEQENFLHENVSLAIFPLLEKIEELFDEPTDAPVA